MTATTAAGDRTMSDLEYEAWAAEVRAARRASGAPSSWRTTTRCRRSRTSRTSPRRLAVPVPGRRRDRRPRDRLLRRALHGRDGQDPVPGQDRAAARPRRRLLAGRLDHRRAAARVEGRAPRRRRGQLRQHHRRGEGRDRHLLHVSSNAADVIRVDPGRPRGPVLPRPVPRRARQAGHRPGEHLHLGGGVPRARRDQPQRRPGADRRPPGRGDPGAPRVRLHHLPVLDLVSHGDLPADRTRVLSTGGMVEAAAADHGAPQVLVATEIGILHQLRGPTPPAPTSSR